MRIEYKGLVFDEPLRFDVLVDDCLLVELKAVEILHPVSKAQLLSYMKLLNVPLGLLINFHEPVLKNGISRMILPGADNTGDRSVELQTEGTESRPASRDSENPTAGDQTWPSSARERKGRKDSENQNNSDLRFLYAPASASKSSRSFELPHRGGIATFCKNNPGLTAFCSDSANQDPTGGRGRCCPGWCRGQSGCQNLAEDELGPPTWGDKGPCHCDKWLRAASPG